MDLFSQLKSKLSGENKTIVFPEGDDKRIIEAASNLANDQIVNPILLGNEDKIKAIADKISVDVHSIEIIDMDNYDSEKYQQMVDALVERRNGKTSEDQAKQWLTQPNYFGTMLVYMGLADGMVSGSANPTGDTVRPALQIIKTKPNRKRVSGSFIMQKGDQRYVFADCAINIESDAQTMAETAAESAHTADLFDIDPKVAMLSFSTKGSAKGPMVDKVQEATKIAKEEIDAPVDGELQFDAAVVPSVGQTKSPDSDVAGKANVFIFPDLQSGNIGYKLAQRLGGFEALGPILQGLNSPVSDLSRGCTAEDAYKVAIINAIQSLE